MAPYEKYNILEMIRKQKIFQLIMANIHLDNKITIFLLFLINFITIKFYFNKP